MRFHKSEKEWLARSLNYLSDTAGSTDNNAGDARNASKKARLVANSTNIGADDDTDMTKIPVSDTLCFDRAVRMRPTGL